MEYLILFNVIPSDALNRIGQPTTGQSEGDQNAVSLSDKILGLLNSEEFLYIFIGVLVVLIICFAFTFHCRRSSTLEHLTDDVDPLSKGRSFNSIRNIRTFFQNTLLNFNNIDEQVAKEHEIKSIDSLTSKNHTKSASKHRQQFDKSSRPSLLVHHKSSKSVVSKSDTKFDATEPIRLKIKIIKADTADLKREAAKKQSPSGGSLNQ